MAANGPWTEPADVARWLYRFGTVPRGPAIDRDFGPDDDPMAVLGLTVAGGTRRRLETAYEATSLQGWYSFARTPVNAQIAAVCKLYVSPRPEALADAFPRIGEAFVQSEVRSFKVGRGIEGLLRPDKIVAYFEDRTHMEDVARVLDRSLRRCPAQGVPFTAEAGGKGLLSCGVDPPAGEAATSWRAWITNRLATSLTTHHNLPGVDCVAAALEDLRQAGVDPERWLLTADSFIPASPQ
jgi:hypothetical protein